MKNVWSTYSLVPGLLIVLFAVGSLRAQGDVSPMRLRGYIKTMPALNLDRDFGDPGFSNMLHNRLNFRWDIGTDLDFRVEGRNRLMYNKLFADFPDVKEIFGHDDGLVDMSWVWLSGDRWIGHSEIDRLYISWRTDSWRIRAGRQRVNWGINLVSNPNDLFNTYSFFDFDYAERPGADAVRVQYYLSSLSNIEVAVSPARNNRDMVAAARVAHNLRGYDIQWLTGYYRDRLAMGGGWAGHIGGAGFKGELTWFYDLEKSPDRSRDNLVAAAGLDYMFPRGTFAILEVLYNGGYGRTPGETFLVTEPLRPDNIMFSEYAITVSADRAFSPVISGGLAIMALPDVDAAFLMPRLAYSLLTDVDMEFVAQIFAGGKSTIFEQAGSAYFVSLQYSF
ncbi:MAG: hypothetical protein EA394_00975 [Bacteroidia bacterium]|nr:MAG: hypothetical protein EA394_00975 [Bacteroidia bacterium]